MQEFDSPQDRPSTPVRVRVAVVLAILLLFVGVALFSPLHKHTPGKSNSCSLNNLEHQMVSLAEAAVALAPLGLLADTGSPIVVHSPFTRDLLVVRGRAPPSFS